MTGERDLAKLLAGLQPDLHAERYAFTTASSDAFEPGTFALIAENEGLTRVAESDTGEWARISLGANSSLEAVGLTAAITAALGSAGISANVIAAFHHDHFFVPWDRRDETVTVLSQLAERP